MKGGFQEKRAASTGMQTPALHLTEPFLQQQHHLLLCHHGQRLGTRRNAAGSQDCSEEDSLARKTWDIVENAPNIIRDQLWQPLAQSSISHLAEGERRQKYFAFPVSISVAVLWNLHNSVLGVLCV